MYLFQKNIYTSIRVQRFVYFFAIRSLAKKILPSIIATNQFSYYEDYWNRAMVIAEKAYIEY